MHKKGVCPGQYAMYIFVFIFVFVFVFVFVFGAISPNQSDQTQKKGVCPGQCDTGNPSAPGMPKQFRPFSEGRIAQG